LFTKTDSFMSVFLGFGENEEERAA
jgi:hypothetical protein